MKALSLKTGFQIYIVLSLVFSGVLAANTGGYWIVMNQSVDNASDSMPCGHMSIASVDQNNLSPASLVAAVGSMDCCDDASCDCHFIAQALLVSKFESAACCVHESGMPIPTLFFSLVLPPVIRPPIPV